MSPPNPATSNQEFGSSDKPRGVLERFICNFFHETNIKWMLVTGAAIVTVCSLRLVAQNWETWPIFAKFLSVLACVGVLFGFSEVSDRWLGLRSTSMVLRCLTLVMIPISFLTLRWLSAQSPLDLLNFIMMFVGGLNAWILSDRIFRIFFHERQPTFQVAYCILSLAGALPVSMMSQSPVYQASAAILVWLIGTMGIVKINRHVFWLQEHHRNPIIFGFFPILLMGIQMALFLANNVSWSSHWEWLGFGIVLCAIPVLATTRSLVHVFQARTGGLISTFPFPVAVPFIISCLMILGGVGLSFVGFRFVGPTTTAVVPTCGMAAILFWLIARDTKQAGFTWLSILCILLAYQCLPTLAKDLSRSIVQASAHTLSEDRLPFAFYGLTYLPLWICGVVTSYFLQVRSKGMTNSYGFLWKPLQQATTISSLVLLLASATHEKAAFVIPSIHIVLFTIYGLAWRDRRYIWVGTICFLFSSGMCVPFLNSMGWTNLSQLNSLCALGIVGLFLMMAPVDRYVKSVPLPGQSGLENVYVVSIVAHSLMGFLSALWCVGLVVLYGQTLEAPAILFSIICLSSTYLSLYRTRRYDVGLAFGVFVIACSLWLTSQFDLPLPTVAKRFLIASLFVTFIGYALVQYLNPVKPLDWIALRKNSLTLRTSGQAERLSLLQATVLPFADLGLLISLIGLGITLATLICAALLMSPVIVPWWMYAVIGWLGLITLVMKNRYGLGCLLAMLPLVVSVTLQLNDLIPQGLASSALVWAVTVCLTGVLPSVYLGGAISEQKANQTKFLWAVPSLSTVSTVWLIVLGVVSPFFVSIPLQCVGLIAVGGLWALYRPCGKSLITAVGLIFANLLFLEILGVLLHWERLAFWRPMSMSRTELGLPLSILFAALVSNYGAVRCASRIMHRNANYGWQGALWVLNLICLIVCSMTPLSSMSVCLYLMSVVSLLALELLGALRYQLQALTWTALIVMTVSVATMLFQRWFILPRESVVLTVALLGVMIHAIGAKVTRNADYQVIGKPFQWYGHVLLSLPGLLGVASLFVVDRSSFGAFTALGLFLVCVYFFLIGHTTRTRLPVLCAMAYGNIGIALFFRRMGWSDLQLYCVPVGLSVLAISELAKQQITRVFQSNLRMIGVLIILVSPVFEILQGRWLHMFTLLLLSVLVLCLSIGARLRAPMFVAIAFLGADLVAMLVRSSIDNPMLLWISGLAIGITVIAIAALCERHREQLLSRIRLMTAELATWN